MTALIIDDERPARVELRRLLAAHPEIEVLAEAENATVALAHIHTLRPELIFLDIQMPGHTGFDLLHQLSAHVPQVIFTTAYDVHAVRAFEVNAVDYLLKPIDPARLASSLRRLKTSESETPEPSTPLAASDRVLLRSSDRSWFVPVASIRLLESVGNYTRVVFDDQQPLIHRTLNALEARLPASHFFRANRGQIINLRWIEHLEDYFNGGLCATLRAGQEKIEISRRRAQEFRARSSL